MKKRHVAKPRSSSQGISRRSVLKGMGYGLGAGAIAPAVVRQAAAATLKAPGAQPVWSYGLPGGLTLGGSATFYKGSILIIGEGDNSDSGGTGPQKFSVLYAIDAQTREARWSTKLASTLRQPVLANGVLYVGSKDGNLYAINADDGSILWVRSYMLVDGTNVVVYEGHLYFFTAAGLTRIDLEGNNAWTGLGANSDLSTPVISSGVGIFRWKMEAWAFRTSGNIDFVWTKLLLPDHNDLAVSGSNVYVTRSLGAISVLTALDIHSGNEVFTTGSLGASGTLSSPQPYNGAIYVANQQGQIFCIDATTGATLWQAVVPASAFSSQFFFDDGILYFNGGTGLGKIFALDITSRGNDIATWSPAEGGYAIGVESGVCYAQLSNGIAAMALADIVHQFFAESELMADDYLPGGSGPAPQNPTYRTHIRLVDTQKNPRSNKSVKVWASAPVTISTGGKSYDIDVASSGKTAWISTDALGELSITSSASGLTTPALYLWGNFMGLEEAIVVYPDHDTITRLSTVQAGDLQQAKAFDGTAMIPATFTAYQDLASTIRSTIGGVSASLAATQHSHLVSGRRNTTPPLPGQIRRGDDHTTRSLFGMSRPRATPATYIAYPQSTTNLLYQPIAKPADRQYVPAGPAAWTANFSDGGVAYSTGATLTDVPGASWKSFEDFVGHVVHGAEDVAKVIWKDGTVVVNGIYQFTVNTVERAMSLITAVMKTVVKDTRKAVEWMSYVFEWGDIVSIKDQLKSQAQEAFADLQTWLRNQQGTAFAGVDGFFKGLENSAQSSLAQAGALIGNDTLRSKQQNGNDPQAIYGAAGAKSYAKSQWLIEKLRQNMSRANVPTYSGSDAMLAAVGQLETSIRATMASSGAFANIPSEVQAAFARFALLTDDPSQFVNHSFNEIFALLSDVMVAFLQFANAVIDDILKALIAFIDDVMTMVALPIDIPYISDFYRAISGGSKLSALDLACLLVAVPTTIVQKALAKSAGFRGSVEISLHKNIGFLMAGAIFVAFDPLMDLTESPASTKWIYLSVCVVLQGLNFPPDLERNSAADYVFFAATAFPLVMVGIDIWKAKNNDEKWKFQAPFIHFFYGAGMIWASVILGLKDEAFGGKKHLLMFQNIFTFVPFLAKFLGMDDKGKPYLAMIDAACDATALGLTVAQDIIG